MDELLKYYIEASYCKKSSKDYKVMKIMAIPPIVPEIDSKWTLCLVYFYPDSWTVLQSQFLGRFSNREEMQIFCDMHGIMLED